MNNSKTADQHDVEDNSQIIVGINLQPSQIKEFPNDLGDVTGSNVKKTDSHTTYDPYNKGCNVEKNLKLPVVVEDNSSSPLAEKINQPVTDCFGSKGSSISDLSELKLNEASAFQDVEDDVSLSQDYKNLDNPDQKLPQFYCLKNKVLVIMKPESAFWFCGKLKVQVLYGAIKIYGAVLNSSTTVIPVEVFAPRNHSLVGIETENGFAEFNEKELWETLSNEGVNQNIKSSLILNIKECQPGWAVILLENFTNHVTRFLSTFCSLKLFPKIEDQTLYSWTDPRRAEVTLQANFRYCKTGKHLIFKSEWKTKVVDKILNDYSEKQESINLIFGGKSVGKSTFSKYLVNSILPQFGTVILINLDVGQTEFTPAGCITLNLIDKPILGPNFTHLKTPYYQLYIGSVNILKCPILYLEGVLKLANIIRNDPKLAGLPVIVNSMGFCRGSLGWDIAVLIIKCFKPTMVIQISSKNDMNNFDKKLDNYNVEKSFSYLIKFIDHKKLSYDLLELNSEVEEQLSNGETWNMEPYQQRDVVMLAYLSQITEENKSIMSNNYTTTTINDVVPYMIPLSSLYLSPTKSEIPLTHYLAGANGNIVALCGFNPANVSIEISSRSSSMEPKVLLLKPLCTCYGFGVIRGIDTEKGMVYLNTPVTSEILQFVNCLMDCVPIPTALKALNLPNAPYRGNKEDIPTCKEHRRGYFKMGNQTAV